MVGRNLSLPLPQWHHSVEDSEEDLVVGGVVASVDEAAALEAVEEGSPVEVVEASSLRAVGTVDMAIVQGTFIPSLTGLFTNMQQWWWWWWVRRQQLRRRRQ